MKHRLILFLILGIDAFILYLESTELSISYREAVILYNTDSFLHHIIHTSLNLFGQNDFALRLPMMLMHLSSALLLYVIAKPYVKYERDRLWLVLIYVLLPGVSSAALLVDNAGLVILLLFLYLYAYSRYENFAHLLLAAFLFVDGSFAILYLGLFFYALKQRETVLLIASLLLFSFSMYLHGFDTGGTPTGHLLDTLGIYAAIFSPIVFIYLFYVLYRRFVTKERDLSWYLATTALLFSLLLSLRQRIELQMFAPYLMLALPLAVQSFFHSYRVRLKIFRKNYRRIFVLSFALLCINALAVFFNKEIYRFLDDTSGHFAYRLHVASEVADALHEKKIRCINANDAKMQLRLKFYGIGYCEQQQLVADSDATETDVTIRYKEKVLYGAHVTKIHK